MRRRNQIVEIDINEGLELYRQTPGALLIDLREKEDYLNSHVPGAINIPYAALREEIRTVATFRTPIFLYCYNGKRSSQAAAMLSSRGYSEARDIGGIAFYTGETTDPTMTIKELRAQRNLKQADFAKSIGLSTVTVSAYETGRQKISAASAEKIRQIYHVQVVDTPPAPAEELPDKPVVKAPGAGRKKKKFTSVKELRSAFRLSQDGFGSIVGISGTAVGHYETGRSNPSRKILDRIQAAFGVELILPEKEGKAGKRAAKAGDTAEAAETVAEEKPRRGRKASGAAKPRKPKKVYLPAVELLSGDGSAYSLADILARAGEAETISIRLDEKKAVWTRGDESGEFDL